jgi:hypothetical protein
MLLRIDDVRPLLAACQAWCRMQAGVSAARPPATTLPPGATKRPEDPADRAPTTPEAGPTSHVKSARAGEEPGPRWCDESPEEQLEQLLVWCVEPDSWAQNGGLGTLDFLGGMLVVRQSRSVHRETEALLNALLKAGATHVGED